MRQAFSTHGLLDTIVSDNGTCYTGATFSEFCRKRGRRHVTIAPRHPSSNGLAERYVRIIKEGMKKLEKSVDFYPKLQVSFILPYHSTNNDSNVVCRTVIQSEAENENERCYSVKLLVKQGHYLMP